MVSDIFRDRISRNVALVNCLQRRIIAGRDAPTFANASANILDALPTATDIQRGTAPKDTVLGRTLLQLIQALGGQISDSGMGRKGTSRKSKLRSRFSGLQRCPLRKGQLPLRPRLLAVF